MEHRTDRDALFSIWGLHHLHLRTDQRATRVRRGDDVLIVFSTGDSAYFVAIVPHPTSERGWETKDIFNAMALKLAPRGPGHTEQDGR